MKKILILFISFLFLIPSTQAQQNIIPVVPQPKEYKFTDDKFSLSNQTMMLKIFCNKNIQLQNAIDELYKTFKTVKNTALVQKGNSSRQILIGIPEQDKYFKKICSDNNIMPEDQNGKEGYKLLINSSKIIIAAKDERGIFYGIQTLKQIIRGTNGSYLHGVIISDWPLLKYRIIMDDISRGPIPNMEYMKKQIRRLSELKINYFTHYVEHVVKTKSHPEFAPVDGSFTIEEWKEISDYAEKYYITVIGNFQSFGHFNNILNTPEYAYLGESGTLISPVNPDSYKFLKDIYSEMIPVFKAPFFNINCDETFDLGKGASKKLVDSLGYAEVYFQHIIKLYDIVKSLNSKVIMWGDVLLDYPELLKKLPKDIIIATWTYDDLESYSKYIDPIKNAGFQFFVTPGVLNSSRLYPLYKQAFGNIKGFVNAAEKSGALGSITTVWDDGGNALFTNDWYGVSYAADKSWNPQSADSINYDKRFSAGIYQSHDNYFTQAIWKLNELADLEPTDGLNDKVLFEKLLPDKGKQLKMSITDWQRVFEISTEAENLIQKSTLKNYSDDKEYLLYTCRIYQTLAKERFDLLETVRYYSQADSLQKINSKEAKIKIQQAIDLIDGIIQRVEMLKNELTELWLNENHTYALDRLTNNYQNKINDYEDVKTKLKESLRRIENNLSILSKEEVRLSISKLPGKYFREWLMVNSLPNKDKQHLSQVDYLTAMGGERNAVPKVTQEFYLDSVKYRWSRITTPYQDIVNLSEIFDKKNNNAVVYAFATIESKKDTSVNAALGFDEGMEIFVNGNSIFKKENSNEIIPDQFQFTLPLHKGINNLMMKITQTNGEWGFTFRLPGSEVRGRKNRYRIISE